MAENIPAGTDLTVPETKVQYKYIVQVWFSVSILNFVVAGNFAINDPQ
jgi:hypothetical protein